jgi:signal transduction histidine kinase
MMSLLGNIRRFLIRSLTLHRRMTLWTAGLLLVMGLGLFVLINSLTAIQIPQAVSIQFLSPTQQTVRLSPTDTGSTSTEDQLQPTLMEPVAVTPLAEQIQEIAIREVRVISLIGIGAFTFLGAFGAYWITRRALQPIRRLSNMVRQIQPNTLHQRLSVDGPQDEVKELADAFDDMLVRLERAFEQQSQFVGNAAHELRTPLATLRTNLEVLQQDSDATLADYQQAGDVQDRALTRLESLVEDLLLLTSGEKEILPEPVDLGVLIDDVLGENRLLAQSYQVSLSQEDMTEVTLPASGLLLARAISNLVGNGIRYNHPNGSVTVSVHRREGWVLISVADTGIGIPSEELPHIFERFYRVDRSRAQHKGGAGLGLSIAAHIVQLHRGYIEATSTPGVGSTFTIWLPVEPGNFPNSTFNRELTPNLLS